MSILVDQVRIAGFRGISNLEISLSRVTVLIGKNNAGKTSIIKALQLSLGDYARHLTEEDFYIDNKDNESSKIIVDVRIVPNDSTEFTDEWIETFGDWRQFDENDNEFVALRTICEKDDIRGGYKVTRYALSSWQEFTNWTNDAAKINKKITTRLESIPFVSIDAQRDIHQELREKTSYVGRILSEIDFSNNDKEALEELIQELNEKAIETSSVLTDLKSQLDSLSQSFQGQGQTEITPFPKKIRDLSKRFSIHFGEGSSNSFSMEYHGMGTRSWASMLTVKAFLEISDAKHSEEEEPFFPIVAAEEPEAHLHPNAQRTLYHQLTKINGQVIISTHSPYLASECKLMDLRSIVNLNSGVVVKSLSNGFSPEDLNKLQRDVMRYRGELLFSNAIILFEGVTEEQLAPVFFEKYFGFSCHSVGVNCISVAGKNYPPFVKMACSLGVPVYIVSDNDGTTKNEINAQISNIERDLDFKLSSDFFNVSYFNDGCDIESELVQHVQMVDELKASLVRLDTNGSHNEHHIKAKEIEVNQISDEDLLVRLANAKSGYSGFLAVVVAESDKEKEKLIPQAFIDAFNAVKKWREL